MVACLATAGLFTLIRSKASELPVVDVASEARSQSVDAGTPRNILLVGTDSSATVDPDDPINEGRGGEHLADVIMVLRVDPTANTAALLSFPRDSYVPVAPSWRKAKINSAFSGDGGPPELIATIKHNFGISIDNFAEVDFGGFRNLVEVLKGVPVYNEHPMRDRRTGLFLPQTGCIVIDPVQALAYNRSRHFQYQEANSFDEDAKWITDPSSDLGRISRQQNFIKQAAQRAIDKGIRNPSTALGLVNAALKSVKVDDNLSVGQIVELIRRFRTFAVDDLKSQQIPTVGNGNAAFSYQIVQWEEAEPLLNTFRGIRGPGETTPADVIVSLPDSSDAEVELAKRLDAAGFDAGADSSVDSGSRNATVIRWGAGGREAAQTLAASLDGNIEYDFDEDLPGRRVELVPGEDPLAVRATPLALTEVPLPESDSFEELPASSTTTSVVTPTTPNPSSTIAETGSTTPTMPAEVTTTTVPGVVPLNADAAGECSG